MPRTTNDPKHRLLRMFGSGVRDLREKADVSQELFAEKVGVHRTYVGMIERGEKSPTLGTISAWAGAFGMTPSELLKKIGL